MLIQPKPLKFRTIWISDVHLGTRRAQAELLLDFLRLTESQTLYLVGDIVDNWALKKTWHWEQSHNDVIQPITADLCEYLERRMQMLPPGCRWLFPSPGSAEGNVHTIRKAFRRCVTRAGMDPDQITPHTLRHTAVTHLVQSGVDLPTVQRISGHKTLAMVARYAHQNGAHIQSAMNRLSDRIGSGHSADDATVTSEKLP